MGQTDAPEADKRNPTSNRKGESSIPLGGHTAQKCKPSIKCGITTSQGDRHSRTQGEKGNQAGGRHTGRCLGSILHWQQHLGREKR